MTSIFNRTKLLFAAVVIIISCILIGNTNTVFSAPEPSSLPPRWEMNIKFIHELRLIQFDGQYYWFMTYLVTNKTGEDQTFVPSATLYTDAGDIITESDGVPYEITKRLLDMIGNPLLESTTQIIGQLKQGKENAREGLLIWKAGNLDIDEVSVFFSGLSSETQVAINPSTKEEVIVRKTLYRYYKIPGEVTANLQHPTIFEFQRWIMR